MATQEAKYADPDQVWKIWIKDGKETSLQFTTLMKLETHKDKFPEIYEAVFKEGGLKDKIQQYVYSQGQEGEAHPTAEIGDQIIEIRYYEDQDSYSVSRKPKKSSYQGGRAQPLLTLVKILMEPINEMNEKLKEQKQGEIYQFKEFRNESDGETYAIVLKLRKVE